MNFAKLTNRIALVAVVLLIYWVFIFVATQVFGFRVFKENITQAFGMSIMGIFVVLLGAVILNIMYNLTSIAEAKSGVVPQSKPVNIKLASIAIAVSFIVIFVALYIGDIATSKSKESRLISSAESLVQEQFDVIEKIAEYEFTEEYLITVKSSINLLSKIDESFPRVTAILRGEIEGEKVLLGFNGYFSGKFEDKSPSDFILGTSSEEREYLHSVFDEADNKHHFSSNDGRYEIYFPVKTAKGIIVLHLSEFNRYGKIGS